jgi:septum formation protein
MGLAFAIMPMDADESLWAEEGAEQAVRRLSLAKALAARDALLAAQAAGLSREQARPEVYIIAADTVVVAPDGRTILGKPESSEQARAMLAQLCNRRHDV